MSEVVKAKRIRRSASTWRRLFARQRRSGLTVAQFCRREGVNATLFSRWHMKLEAVPSTPARSTVESSTSASPFIELGELGRESARFDVRLELGAGLVLSIARH